MCAKIGRALRRVSADFCDDRRTFLTLVLDEPMQDARSVAGYEPHSKT